MHLLLKGVHTCSVSLGRNNLPLFTTATCISFTVLSGTSLHYSAKTPGIILLYCSDNFLSSLSWVCEFIRCQFTLILQTTFLAPKKAFAVISPWNTTPRFCCNISLRPGTQTQVFVGRLGMKPPVECSCSHTDLWWQCKTCHSSVALKGSTSFKTLQYFFFPSFFFSSFLVG